MRFTPCRPRQARELPLLALLALVAGSRAFGWNRRPSVKTIHPTRWGRPMLQMAGEGAGMGVVVAGAPSSGKGTQAARLADKFGFVLLSTDDLVEQAGKSVDDVNDQELVELVATAVNGESCQSNGWLLDGFPRTVAQAEALQQAGADVNCFLNLQVPDILTIERLSVDSPERAKAKLDEYHDQVIGITERYRDVMETVDGSLEPDLVFDAATEKVELAIARVTGKGRGILVSHPTTPIEGMKMGTSGLRKKVSVASEGVFLKNFVQALFNALPEEDVKGGTLVVSGDGRHYNKEALQTIISIAAANGVGAIWVGEHGIMSTPAISATVRERMGGRAFGAIILTASHNPGGPDGDFGIKYNTADGAPAKEDVTDAIFHETTVVNEYKIIEDAPMPDLSRIGSSVVVGNTTVQVIDPLEDYVRVLRRCFSFVRIKSLLARPDFNMVFDGMHGAAGPYAKRVLGELLGAPPESLVRCEPLEDFGGLHPDPNLGYAAELIDRMGVDVNGAATAAAPTAPQFGAAADGDGDRNMILGPGFFVTPSDSLAVLAANWEAIPQFAQAQNGLVGVARSMPTSKALDVVADELDMDNFETPTGWKFFGNLMEMPEYDTFLCGEESFGTGSSHIREKDGLWAVLAWLSVIAQANINPETEFVGVQQIVERHWQQFGRHFYMRYDYEGVDSEAANQVMEHLRGHFRDLTSHVTTGGMTFGDLKCTSIEEFTYIDPVDDSLTVNQGLILNFEFGPRAIFRLSGTGSEGATIRLYLEDYERDEATHKLRPIDVLKPVEQAALIASQLVEFTGRESPTVIT